VEESPFDRPNSTQTWPALAAGPRSSKGAPTTRSSRSGVLVDIARKVGQQSLAVFLASLFLAQTAGTAMNVVGHSYLSVAIINFIGFAGLFAVALIAGWFKSSPWKKTGARPAPVGSEAGPAKSRTSEEQIREDTDDYARQMTPRVSPAE
jgi:hypothetical protein